jgi:Na+/H+ antiporter NhaA
MNRWLTVPLCPPCAVVDCGCAAHCNAPIGVLYATGIFAIVYGLFFGGPLGTGGVSWGTVLLGLALWGVSAAWAAVLLARYGEHCATPQITQPTSATVKSDPFEDVKKAKSG